MIILCAARDYARLGWSVIPIGSQKKPALQSWREFQTRRATDDELGGMFSRATVTGLAVVLGPVSGNLYCRDFDAEDAYKTWAAENDNLAQSLPTAKTARGIHIYFRCKDVLPTRKFVDGELRGKGAYVLIPPSLHPSGVRYAWVGKPDLENIPFHELHEVACTERVSVPSVPSVPSVQGPSVPSVQGNRSEDEVVALALPTTTHDNHRLIFKLACACHSLNDTAKRRIFDAWWKKSKEFARPESSRDDYLLEFLEALPYVKFPLGAENPVVRAFSIASAAPPPDVALQFEGGEMRALVALCRELQREAGDQPFFLSCRTVARLFKHENHNTAANRLRGLVQVGILKVVVRATPTRAIRYRYLHSLAKETP